MDEVGVFFESFLKKESLFKDKRILQSSYEPEEIIHREEQISQVAKILAPCLKLERPSNLFIYGKTGTGKTLVIKHITKKLNEIAKNQNISLRIVYLNCKLKKIADTEYRVIAEISRLFGKAVPVTGLPTDEIYNIFFSALDKEKQTVILILDEIDQLVNKTGDEIIYNLTRINTELKNAQISIIGISNNLTFADTLDPRVKSSLSEEEIVFPPYNALQIQDILKKRSMNAFKEGVMEEGVISKCSAYAAREHGDARRALELLRVAGELTERKELNKITLTEIDEAEEKIERDRFTEIIETQPKQFMAVLYSIFLISESKKEFILTGEIYDIYKKICAQTGLRSLTQRRVSDILQEFDMLGIINAKVISKGRYGRTREIKLSLPENTEHKIKNVLEQGLNLK